jgi:putative component of toxin-antitoxin plasmid stabilization module
MDYSSLVIEIFKSDTFSNWLAGLKDRQARVRIGWKD